MRVFVIGGTAFIGRETVRLLHERGHDVTLFHRGRTDDGSAEGITHIYGDRHDAEELRRAAVASRPEVVLDMIAMAESEARTTVAAARGVARRLVVASSIDVYRAYGRLHGSEPGSPDPMPLTEDSPVREAPSPDQRLRPRPAGATGPDDRDKILVERLLMASADLPATVLRLPAVYGARDPQHRTAMFLHRMDAGRPVIPLPAAMAPWHWSRGYVTNVAHALALAVTDDRAAGRTYNVTEPEALAMADWVRAVGEAAGWRGEVVTMDGEAAGELYGGAFAGLDWRQQWIADSTRVRAELGYAEIVPPEQGLAHAVAWERGQPVDERTVGHYDYAAEDALLARASVQPV